MTLRTALTSDAGVEAVARAILNVNQRRCKQPETQLSDIDDESGRYYCQEARAAIAAVLAIAESV